eukprot:CAMPEP_0113575754 /NCGR_PEP_ID=MMETSP0015_2-20120614/27880_1 /TAXON_ID=2838 /ORGANISM="Odontella" /LENGTH=213 /DNA_ID=CAMNT_0000479041 /DNA_START=54 /DNA_END=692 /DNA_ORIENTATION=+ /assembly_acc=CAM_ASM_000160
MTTHRVNSDLAKRLRHSVVVKLIECGWRDEMKGIANEAIRKRGITEITVDELTLVLQRYSMCLPGATKADIISGLRRIVEGDSFLSGDGNSYVGNFTTEPDLLLRFILKTRCVEIASAMHRLAKTRVLSLSSIMSPTNRETGMVKRRLHYSQKPIDEFSIAGKKVKLESNTRVERHQGDDITEIRDSLGSEAWVENNNQIPFSARASASNDIW